jgi:TolB protein
LEKRLAKALCAVAAVLLFGLASCTTEPGGGGGTPTFQSGFVYIRRDDGNVYLADDTAPTIPIPVTSGGDNHMPALSRDARKVVFVHRSGSSAEIDTISVNAASGIPPTTVLSSTGNANNFRLPIFSPDGSYIVFAYDSSQSSFLGRVNVDGSSFQRIVGSSAASYTSPSFFPNGHLLAAAGNSPSQYDMLVDVSLTGGVVANVTSLPNELLGVANRAQISSDGNQIALDGLSRVSGVSWLYGYSIPGRQFTRLVFYQNQPTVNETFPTWVGISQVGYSSDYGGNDSVYLVAASAHDSSGTLKVPSAIQPFYGPY